MTISRPRPMVKRAVRTRPEATRAAGKGEAVIATESLEVPAWKKSLEAGIRAGRRRPVRTLSVIEKKRLREVEKEYHKNHTSLSCAFCKGSGIDPHGLSPLSKCVACSGRGYAFVTEPYETCKACAGTGRYIGTHIYCWTCRGKGVVPKE